MTRAIGFDLGETLLTYAETPPSWASLYRPALGRAAEICGIRLDEPAFTRAAQILARYNTRLEPRAHEVGADKIFEEILADWNRCDAPIEPVIAAFFDFFQQRLVSYPESAVALTTLRSTGYRIGVLTDVPYGMPRAFVERDLRAGGLDAAIDLLLTSVEVGWRKPSVEGFHGLAQSLGVPTSDLWYVGNEEKDIVGARAAGAKSVLIDRENRQPRWGQAHSIRDLRELQALLSG